MGKASRRKKTNQDRAATRKRVERLVRDLDLSTGSRDSVWVNAPARLSGNERERLEDLRDRLAEAVEMPRDTYEVIWQSTRSARATWPLFHDLAAEVMSELDRIEPGGRLVDVGGGIGVLACFVARHHPDAEVVMVEPLAVACDVASEFAAQLRLGNLTVVNAPLADLTPELVGGVADTLLCSLTLVEATALNHLPDADPWSTTNSIQAAVEEDPPVEVAVLQSLLSERGAFVGVERAGDPVSLARWLGWIARMGLGAEELVHLDSWGEHIPFVVARPGEPMDAAALASSIPAEELAVESTLAADPPSSRIDGVHVVVADESGHGETRVEALRLSSGDIVTLTRSSRGFRSLEEHADEESAASALAQFRMHLLRDPSVVRTTTLPAETVDGWI